MRLLRLLAPLVMVLGVMSGCAAPRQARTPTPEQPHLKVMTYNVNFGLAGDPATLAAIAAEPCDAVFLQETTPQWEALIREHLSEIYPHMIFVHSPGAGGLAVLSRRPFEVGPVLAPPPGGWFPAQVVTLETPIGPVQALTVHLRPPVSDGGSFVSGYFTTGAVRRESIESFLGALDPELPTLVLGDFNEGQGGDALEVLEARGLRSVLGDFDPGATTWRWTTSVGEITSTLDHIVHDARLEPLDARVLQRGRSDHLPIVALFERADPDAP